MSWRLMLTRPRTSFSVLLKPAERLDVPNQTVIVHMSLFASLAAAAPPAASAGKGGRQPPVKRARGLASDKAADGEDNEQIVELLANVAKLSLRSAESDRALRSVCFDFVELAADSLAVTAARAATKSYANVANSIRSVQPLDSNKLDAIGLPSSHAWNAIFETTITAMRKKNEETQDLQQAISIMEEHRKEISEVAEGAKRFTELQYQVRHCSLKRGWNSKIAKLDVHCERGTNAHAAWKQIIMFLVKYEGARYRQGPAPRGGLEREIQASLDRMGLASDAA
eukprot:TRINITY_DN66071_c1_g1_i1.p2 TRINITY_DN66071_c1_g1~~TRINITY_DN66071_c1_g1_i1.p2  ORF type:complete len:283 (+),score=68.33 TRINITY_DN66071_c1_g1_i1:136-984(+)